jgi:hypothetical protein
VMVGVVVVVVVGVELVQTGRFGCADEIHLKMERQS